MQNGGPGLQAVELASNPDNHNNNRRWWVAWCGSGVYLVCDGDLVPQCSVFSVQYSVPTVPGTIVPR